MEDDANDLSRADRELLDAIQGGFPMVERPFAAIAERLGRTEREVLEDLRRLKRGGVVRRISAVFDTKALGYRSTLVAMRVDPERLEEAAECVNRHPGVSHNYARNHDWNLWFTLALPPTSRLGLERTAAVLCREADAEAFRLLPSLRVYKIGVRFDLSGGPRAAGSGDGRRKGRRRVPLRPPDELDVALVRAMQRDLPLEPEPFAPALRELGMSMERLRSEMERLREEGRLRRFAAVLNHRRAGFRANAMGVWRVDEGGIDEVGRRMAAFPEVTHCYRRPSFPDWPYNLFTMVHGRTRPECEEVLERMSRETGVSDREVLYSTREFKKVRLTYFDSSVESWESERAARESHPAGERSAEGNDGGTES